MVHDVAVKPKPIDLGSLQNRLVLVSKHEYFFDEAKTKAGNKNPPNPLETIYEKVWPIVELIEIQAHASRPIEECTFSGATWLEPNKPSTAVMKPSISSGELRHISTSTSRSPTQA